MRDAKGVLLFFDKELHMDLQKGSHQTRGMLHRFYSMQF